MAIRLPNPEGGLTIGDVDCNTSAFSIYDLTDLIYGWPADDGENLVTPDVEGEEARYIIPRARECVLPWVIGGNRTLDGDAVIAVPGDGYAAWWDQALVNFLAIREALGSFGIGVEPPSKTAVFVSAGGSITLSGGVQVRGMQRGRTLRGHGTGDHNVVVLGTMRLRILAGELAVAGS